MADSQMEQENITNQNKAGEIAAEEFKTNVEDQAPERIDNKEEMMVTKDINDSDIQKTDSDDSETHTTKDLNRPSNIAQDSDDIADDAEVTNKVKSNGIMTRMADKEKEKEVKGETDEVTPIAMGKCENSVEVLEVGPNSVLMRFGVSKSGQIVYCCHRKVSDKGVDSFRYSIGMIQDKWVTPLVPEAPCSIAAMTFVQIPGREHLVWDKNGEVLMMDERMENIQANLIKVKGSAVLCPAGEGRLICASIYPINAEYHEIQELHITKETGSFSMRSLLPRSMWPKSWLTVTKVKLGWEEVHDICHMTSGGSDTTMSASHMTGNDIIIMCSWKANSVAAVRLCDGEIQWRIDSRSAGINLEDALSVCADKAGHVFIACRQQHAIYQVAGDTGAVLGQLELQPSVMFPTCVRFHDNKLSIAHVDSGKYKTLKQVKGKISHFVLS